MLAILNSLNAHNFPIFQPILMILVSKFMVHRALSDKIYLSLGLLSPLIHMENQISTCPQSEALVNTSGQVDFFSPLWMPAANAQASLRICADSPEHFLLHNAINTIIRSTGSFVVLLIGSPSLKRFHWVPTTCFCREIRKLAKWMLFYWAMFNCKVRRFYLCVRLWVIHSRNL